MRDFNRFDEKMSRYFTPVVKWLVYICVIMFIIEIFLGPPAIASVFGASAGLAIYHGWVWQFVTYMFVHASPGHLLFNLFALWMFGTRLEQRWGSQRFLRFVIVVGAGAVTTHMAVTLIRSIFLYTPIVGISGVIYGILLVYAYYWPDDTILLYGIIPMKAKTWVLIVGAITFFSSFDFSSQIAHLTHLGGLLFGYLFVRYPNIFDRIPIPWPRSRKPGHWTNWR